MIAMIAQAFGFFLMGVGAVSLVLIAIAALRWHKIPERPDGARSIVKEMRSAFATGALDAEIGRAVRRNQQRSRI